MPYPGTSRPGPAGPPRAASAAVTVLTDQEPVLVRPLRLAIAIADDVAIGSEAACTAALSGVLPFFSGVVPGAPAAPVPGVAACVAEFSAAAAESS